MTALQALAPTHAALADTGIFAVRYTWTDKLLGELTGNTVILGADEEAALAHFRSQHPHLTSAKIIPN